LISTHIVLQAPLMIFFHQNFTPQSNSANSQQLSSQHRQLLSREQSWQPGIRHQGFQIL